ncbi:tetratricopeptide repeat protein [Streptomyces sp. NPDC047042]|uniref:tetratricopeptide repeat protein n=1 Tax=Streptomyces sp. NPDC047042 TaxID=3154807 RepID=UPI003404E777
MPPRTNDNAPASEHSTRPTATPGATTTPETAPFADAANAGQHENTLPGTTPAAPTKTSATPEPEDATRSAAPAGAGEAQAGAARTAPASGAARTPGMPGTEAAPDGADADPRNIPHAATPGEARKDAPRDTPASHVAETPGASEADVSPAGADAGHEGAARTAAPAGAGEADEARTSAPIATRADGQGGSGDLVDGPGNAPAVPGPGGSGDERIVAVRRVGESSRRWRAVQLGACAVALAVAFTGGAMVLGAVRDGGGTASVPSAPAAMSPALLASGNLDASIASLQAHLRAQPKDFGSWATLGLAYVEQARTKGDPSRYPQAQQALNRSLEVEPDNDPALAGRAALAAARHDFPGALKYSDQALAQNPYSERALSTRIDALVELGRYDEALKATDEADAKRPGVPVFTRYAYVRELRGDVKTARRVLEQALNSATSRGDIAYVATALGQLAWNQGEYKSALEFYARALAADDAYLPALEGRSRAQFADGDRAGAIKGMEDVVSRYPLPGPLVELGELYEVRAGDGDLAKARDQYALVNAWTAIARANGVNADLDTALAAADHGDRKSALRAARAEWDRRETVHTADALAWALHVNGKDEEALPYARRATATGYRNASFLYHRGMIEQATGHAKEARASLSAALELNPGFSPLGARKARTALKSLEAAK